MLWRRPLAGGEPWKFEDMWNWSFLELSIISNGGYRAQTAISEWSEAIGVAPFYACPIVTILFLFSFFIRLSFEIDAHALMNERGKGRDTENYDETSKMGLPFFTLCCSFVLLFFFLLSIWTARGDRGEKCPKGTSEGAQVV